MKVYVCVVGFFCALVLVRSDLTLDENKAIQKCANDSGINKEYGKGEPPLDNPKVKCFTACVMKYFGSLVNGKVDVQKLIEFSSKTLNGTEVNDTLKAYMAECTQKANTKENECDVAGIYVKCITEKQKNSKN